MLMLPLFLALVPANAPDISIKLLGAQRVACANAEENSDGLACYSVNAGHPMRIRIASTDERRRITAGRYFVKASSTSKALRSGQFIDGKGRDEWHTDLELPSNEEKTTSYDLFVEAESDGRHIERTFRIMNVAHGRSDAAWTIAGTSIRLAPSGCWHEVREVMMTLSLESCDKKLNAIKAVVVSPARGLTLQQYVTNSVEVYSRRETWAVSRRGPLPSYLGEGEMLELAQTIGEKQQLINKYFLRSGEKIVVVTRYYSDHKPPASDDVSWLTVPALESH